MFSRVKVPKSEVHYTYDKDILPDPITKLRYLITLAFCECECGSKDARSSEEEVVA
jgi:hypothetical protein